MCLILDPAVIYFIGSRGTTAEGFDKDSRLSENFSVDFVTGTPEVFEGPGANDVDTVSSTLLE